MTRYVDEQSTLEPSHRLLLALRTAWLDQSETLWTSYADRGAVEHPEVVQLALGLATPDDVAGSLLQFADELVLTSSVTDSTWARLAGGHDVHWLMDAVETVAHQALLCCLANSFGVPTTVMPRSPERPSSLEREPPLTEPRIEPVDGPDIAVLRTFARHPVMASARRPRSRFINQVSALSPHDRETLILRIGWDCQSEYEWSKHVGSVGHARDHGVDPALVAAGPAAPASRPRRPADAGRGRPASGVDGRRPHLGRPGRDVRATSGDEAVFTASSYRSTSMSLNTYGVQHEPDDEGFLTFRCD